MINPGESKIFFSIEHILLVVGSRPSLTQKLSYCFYLNTFLYKTVLMRERAKRVSSSASVCKTIKKKKKKIKSVETITKLFALKRPTSTSDLLLNIFILNVFFNYLRDQI